MLMNFLYKESYLKWKLWPCYQQGFMDRWRLERSELQTLKSLGSSESKWVRDTQVSSGSGKEDVWSEFDPFLNLKNFHWKISFRPFCSKSTISAGQLRSPNKTRKRQICSLVFFWSYQPTFSWFNFPTTPVQSAWPGPPWFCPLWPIFRSEPFLIKWKTVGTLSVHFKLF